ncbi:MAG: UvrD-helicase domain-containing protein [Clostridiales bacterium]|jgi:ATP-dependent exoDNAse (exonuclease V) beta subunit|nr:UvrD-helicase domain-containing protein [Clostridiales bacterium]
MPYTPEQLQAIRSESPDILVAASAGSGKTEIMTQRAARLLLSGVAPESMAIVTFTTGAAAEMKARLAAILTEQKDTDKRGAAALSPLQKDTDKKGAAALSPLQKDTDKKGAAALNLLKAVKIGTLHSFCRAVIRQFFWKIGADPNFSVADEGKAAALRRSAAGKTLESFLEKDAPGFAELTDRLAFMRGDEALKDLIVQIAETARNGPDPGAWLQARFEEAGADGDDGPHVRFLLQAAEEYDKQYARLKADKGLMDFSDLENKTLEILRDGESLAAARRIWRYIFVDEYQDVNPAQEQIISALGEGGNLFLVGDPKQSIYGFRACDAGIFVAKSLDTARREVIRLNANFRSKPEILDFCNDVFSGLMTPAAGGVDYAREAIFRINAQCTMHNAQLSDNAEWNGHFSLSQPVTESPSKENSPAKKEKSVGELSNAQCTMHNAQLKDEILHIKQNDRESIRNDDEKNKSEIVNCELCIVNYKTPFPKICVAYDGGAEEEAELIAREIEILRAQGYQYADIVILTRWLSSSYARALAAALTARGVPLSLPRLSDAGDGFLLDLLRVADNRRQDIPLAAVMRGAFFGFTDGELARIRLRAPDEEFFYDAVFDCAREKGGKDGLGEKTAAFLNELDALSRVACALPAAEFIDYVARRFRYRDYLAAGADGSERFENFLRKARVNGPESLSEFLLHLDEEACGGAAEPAPASDAVRLTTVHRSKGAQYPAVILAGTGKAYINRHARRPALVDLTRGLALKPNGHFSRVMPVRDIHNAQCNGHFSLSEPVTESPSKERGHFSLSQPVTESPSKENSPAKKEKSVGELLSGDNSQLSENAEINNAECRMQNAELSDRVPGARQDAQLSGKECHSERSAESQPIEACRYESILNALYAAELSEEVRVLYVALTRAKERLIVTGCMREKDGEKGADGEAGGGQSALKWLLAHKSPHCEYGFYPANSGHFSLSEPVREHNSQFTMHNAQLKDKAQGAIQNAELKEKSEIVNCELSIVNCKKSDVLNTCVYPYAADLRRPAKTTATALNNSQFTIHNAQYAGHFSHVKPVTESPSKENSPIKKEKSVGELSLKDKTDLLNSQFSILNSQFEPFNSKDVGTAYHAALNYIGDINNSQFTMHNAQLKDNSNAECGMQDAKLKEKSEIENCELRIVNCKKSDLLNSQFSILTSFLDSLLARNVLTPAQRAAIDPAVLALYFQSPLPGMVARADKVYRERNFIYDDDGMIVQGRLDLLLAEGDGLTVADYKLSGGDPEAFKTRYAAQIRIYARAAADMLGKPIKAAYFYHINTGKLIAAL